MKEYFSGIHGVQIVNSHVPIPRFPLERLCKTAYLIMFFENDDLLSINCQYGSGRQAANARAYNDRVVDFVGVWFCHELILILNPGQEESRKRIALPDEPPECADGPLDFK
jgi:hypothetical protein